MSPRGPLWRVRKRQPAYALDVVIPGVPKLPNQLLHAHWRTSHANTTAWRNLIAAHVRDRPLEPLTVAEVILTRITAREPDPDGLAASFKPILDALQRIGVLEDDRSGNFVGASPVYRWSRGMRGRPQTRVEVRSIEAMPEPPDEAA